MSAEVIPFTHPDKVLSVKCQTSARLSFFFSVSLGYYCNTLLQFTMTGLAVIQIYDVMQKVTGADKKRGHEEMP